MGNFSSKKWVKKNKKKKNERFSFYDYSIKEEYDEREHLGIVILKEVFKGNFSSPIQDILSDPNTRILDVGCGSGFWLTDMAAEYPKPRYFGVDAFPTFPKSTVPNNIEFFQHNILEGLPFEDNTFDFIHIHFLVGEVTESQWENSVYQEVARLLKPGGWLEVSDPDIEIKNSGPITAQTILALRNHIMSNNFNPHLAKRHDSIIKSVPPFSSSIVYHVKGQLKIGSYDGKLGEISAQHMKDICRYIYTGPAGQGMIKQEEIESNLDKIEKEFDHYQSYTDIHRYYVRKPQK